VAHFIAFATFPIDANIARTPASSMLGGAAAASSRMAWSSRWTSMSHWATASAGPRPHPSDLVIRHTADCSFGSPQAILRAVDLSAVGGKIEADGSHGAWHGEDRIDDRMIAAP